jgi:hypothetical protein
MTSTSVAYRAWKRWSPGDFGVCTPQEAHYFDVEMAQCGVRIQPGTSVLEIGFGNGKFASWAVLKGATYVGTELDDALVNLARDRGFDAHAATRNLSTLTGDRKQKLVVALDVFEHLSYDEISALLRAASQCVDADGVIIARFPSGDSPFARSTQYGDLTHRSVIGSGIVYQLAMECGLDVVQVRSPVFPLSGMGVRTFFRRAPIALVRAFVSRIVNLVFHDNQPKVVTANMLIVLRSKEPREKPHELVT